MKKNGFTLIELLAVLLILSIVLTITIYSVSSILNNAEKSLSDTQKKRIIESAKDYYLNEGMDLEYGNGYTNKVCVNISTLVSKQYIELDKVTDPETNQEMTGAVIIERDVSGTYTYTYRKTPCQSEYN